MHTHEDLAHVYENKALQGSLFNDVKILCWILTTEETLMSKAQHVYRTWGSRCNKILFMSTKPSDELPNVVALSVTEGYDHLWGKTKAAFKYVYENHLNDFDWFFKADDDTYAIVENLRYLLYPYSPSDPLHFGCKFRALVDKGYHSGGAGYVLSREAVKRFVKDAIPDASKCRQDSEGGEDVEIAKCLASVGVLAGDSRDAELRNRFFPFTPEGHVVPGKPESDSWYWRWIYYKTSTVMRFL